MEKIKLFCVSLGCDKNLVDTEKMLGVAGGRGVPLPMMRRRQMSSWSTPAALLVMPKRKVLIRSWRWHVKRRRKMPALIVAGCLAQRYKQEIMDEIPEVDAILGTTSYEEIGNVLTRCLGK